jgi:transposase
MHVSEAAETLGVYPNRLWNVFDYWIYKFHQEDEIDDLRQVGFDETSVKKGHKYVTTMVCLKERRILFATEGKGANCIEKSVDYLKEKGVAINKVKQVCIDMSPAFISGCINHLPNAEITFDKFHVVKEVKQSNG